VETTGQGLVKFCFRSVARPPLSERRGGHSFGHPAQFADPREVSRKRNEGWRIQLDPIFKEGAKMGEDIFAQRKSGRMAALARLPFRFDQGLALSFSSAPFML
jgi:hypothetical protein